MPDLKGRKPQRARKLAMLVLDCQRVVYPMHPAALRI
jgi:hypothetical protein